MRARRGERQDRHREQWDELAQASRDGLEYRSDARNLHRIFEGEPLSAFNSYEREISLLAATGAPACDTVSTLSSTAEEFQLTNLVEGYEGDCRIFAKTWRRAVPRDFV